MTERWIPERKAVKLKLRSLGMSNRQVLAFLRGGWKSLVGETEAENAELNEQITKLMESLNKQHLN